MTGAIITEEWRKDLGSINNTTKKGFITWNSELGVLERREGKGPEKDPEEQGGLLEPFLGLMVWEV